MERQFALEDRALPLALPATLSLLVLVSIQTQTSTSEFMTHLLAVNIMLTSHYSCGGAGKTCPAVANGTPICSAGTCSATCSTGYTLSSGKCVNTNTDVNK